MGMSEHEENLRDLAAMFAMCGLLIKGGAGKDIASSAYEIADAMLVARSQEPEPEQGIVAIKPKRKRSE